MSQQIKTVSQLDAQHTRTLKNDENQLAQLERDLADGRRRLHLQAPYSPMPSAASAPSVDDAPTPRLTDATQRDYFTLRAPIALAEQQITGLQAYVQQVCLNQIQK
ncbi:lysis protein [Candidatus Williamhamiltonella defendens]|uniref:lysis protein n=1 Tax=Candidatus Williamhamiltonella defendens TaxID=138072 RepID=UPI0022787C10|nr:lysis protein [Candidatus Hamiltonella defensa]